MGQGNGNGVREAPTNEVGIYIFPTEEGKPPGAQLQRVLRDDGPIIVISTLDVEYTDGAWRDEEGNALPDEMGAVITAQAEELGVEWEH